MGIVAISHHILQQQIVVAICSNYYHKHKFCCNAYSLLQQKILMAMEKEWLQYI
jgi:hypothetical protein